MGIFSPKRSSLELGEERKFPDEFLEKADG